jgi:hypothetical protein
MYLDYESFVDCLIKGGYEKTCSDLTTETWSNGVAYLVIIIDDDIIIGMETFYLED